MKSIIAAALFAVLAAGSAQGTIITNGNFESGMDGWSTIGDVALASQHGDGFYFGAGSVAQDGAHAIAFSDGNAFPISALWQSFTTTIGKTYTVSFDYGSTSGSSFAQGIAVDVFGATPLLPLAGDIVIDNNPAAQLDTYTFNFVATSAMTTLSFADLPSNKSFNVDGVLDNVSVSLKGPTGTPPAAVPEPDSLALLALGGLGVGFVRRRRAA